MNRILPLSAVLVALLAGCSTNGEPKPASADPTPAANPPAANPPAANPPAATPPAATPPAADHGDGTQAPVVITVRGPEKVAANATIDVVVAIDRRGRTDFAVDVEVKLPAGTRLASGAPRVTVPSGATQADFKVTVDTVPAEDIIVLAKAGDGKSWGVTAEGRYTFGRGDAKLPQPDRTGPNTTLPGGRNLGTPVKAK